MIATVAIALALAATEPAVIRVAQVEPAPAIEARRVLVLRNPPSALDVRSYRVDGLMVKALGMDGEPLIMRASAVDLEESERRSVAAQAEAERVLAEQVEAQRELEAEAERRAEIRERNAEQRRTSTRRPGLNIAGGSAYREARTDSEGAPEIATLPDSPPSSAAGDGRARLDSLRGQYKAARAAAASKRAAREKALTARQLLIGADGRYRTFEGIAIGAQLLLDADRYAREAEDAEADAAAVKAEFLAAQEATRRSGADAIVWRGTIDG